LRVECRLSIGLSDLMEEDFLIFVNYYCMMQDPSETMVVDCRR
jgi:hypothetical protein